MNNEPLRNLRTEIMIALYQYDLYTSEKLAFIPEFEHTDALMAYQKIVDKLANIDEIIETNLFDYRLNRLSYVDRAIIRLAVYELSETNLPSNIIINEAILLTKTYSNLDDEKQHRFTNKVLDAIAKNIRG
jgi:N utilization substance protein B